METQRKYAGSRRLSPAARRVVTAALVAATISAPTVAIATEPDFAAAGIEASEGAYVADSGANLLGDQLVSADEAVKTTSVQEDDATAEVKAPSYEWYTSKDKNATYFEISTAEDLMGLAKITQGDVALADGTKITKDDFKGKTVALNNDIDLQGITWVDVKGGEGSSLSYASDYRIRGFAGTFDGRGHVIRNLVLNDEAVVLNDKQNVIAKNIGLFYSIDGGSVDGLTLDGVTINATANTRAAPLAAFFAGSISNCHIKNVSVSVSDSDEGKPASYAFVGGLVRLSGYSVGSKIPYVKSDISDSSVSGVKVMSVGQQLDFAGLADYSYATKFSHDSVSEVNIDVDNAYNIAGFVATTDYNAGTNTDSKYPFSTFDSCGVSGLKITASKRLQYTGGFAGCLNRGGKLSDCYVDGFSLESNSETKIEGGC